MTPTLAMAVQREAAIAAFTPEKFYTVSLAFEGDGTASSKRFSQKEDAETLLANCRKEVSTVVQKVERKEKNEKPPQLYDLTTLQRDANRLLGFTAQQTLNYAQSLYEKKLISSGRTHTYADGHTVKEVRPRYSCFYKIRHPGDCDGQSGYGVSKLDSIVEEVVRQIFAQFREVSRKKLLESVKTNDAARIQKKIKKIQKDLEAKQKELDDLKAETILVIRGVSALDKELLGTLVAETKDALETLEKQLVQAQEEYEEATKTAKRSNYICNELFTWADVYDTANHDERRAILQQFIKEIRVRKDYEISITLNASFNQVEQLKAVSTYDGAEIFEEISEKGA